MGNNSVDTVEEIREYLQLYTTSKADKDLLFFPPQFQWICFLWCHIFFVTSWVQSQCNVSFYDIMYYKNFGHVKIFISMGTLSTI